MLVSDRIFSRYGGASRRLLAFLYARGAPPPRAHALRATALGLAAPLARPGENGRTQPLSAATGRRPGARQRAALGGCPPLLVAEYVGDQLRRGLAIAHG